MLNNKKISEKADVCVKCGFCLPVCPTYALNQQEADSPRGRISLIQSIVDDNASVHDETLQQHLQGCLTCRACEAMCPAQVEYGQLIDFAKSILPKQRGTSFWVAVLSRKWLVRFLARGLFVHQKIGLHALFQKIRMYHLFGLGRLSSYIPSVRHFSRLKNNYKPRVKKGRVGLFLGCVADEFDRQTLTDAVRILTHMGYEVVLPKQQGCCGAMHKHTGYTTEAQRMQVKNNTAFSNTNVEAILYCASGCAESLKHSTDTPVLDVNAFILERLERLVFKPLKWNIMVHLPCTQRNVMRQEHLAFDLLNRIPDLKTTPLPGNEFCCGAAGIHMLKNPQAADEMRHQKLNAISHETLDALVTTNIGCSMHLSAGLCVSKKKYPVLHPVSVLANSVF